MVFQVHNKSKYKLYKRWKILKDGNNLCVEWGDFFKFNSDVKEKFMDGYSLRKINKNKKHSIANSYWFLKGFEKIYFTREELREKSKEKVKIIINSNDNISIQELCNIVKSISNDRV